MKVETVIEKMYIKKLSDAELVDKYNFMKNEIESRRKTTGFGGSKNIEFKYRLLKEIKERGLTYE